MLKRKTTFVILAVVCLLVYANSLNNAFVSDDIPAILHNFQIQHTLSFLSDPQSLLNSLIYNIAKFNVAPYHLASVILHFINAALVFLFLSLFFRAQPSFLGALLFAVHPVHTEAVAWISGRAYLFLAFFLLVSYLLYYKSTTQEKFKPLFYLLSLGIFSYYIIRNFTFYTLFPIFIILSDVIFNRWRKNWKLWIPFFFIAILRIILASDILPERIVSIIAYLNCEAGNSGIIWRNPVPPFVYSVFSHFWLLLWPVRLTFYYEPITYSPLIVWLGIIVFAIFICFLPYIFRKSKIVLLGLGMFILFLAPTYAPVPIATVIAERYVYFPSIFLSILAAFFYERYFMVQESIKHFPIPLRKSPKVIAEGDFLAQPDAKSRKWATILFIIVLVGCGVRSMVRNADWKDSSRLFKATLNISPASPSAHNGMGAVYFHEGDIERAIAEFTTAIKLKSNYAEAYNNRATAYYNKGDFSAAISDLTTAIKLKSNYALAYYNRGVAYYNRNELTQAISDLTTAIKLKSGYAEAYHNRAIAYFFSQEYTKSWEDVRKLEGLGYPVDSRFLQDLKKVTPAN